MNVSGKVQGKDTVAPAWTVHSTHYFTTTTEHTFVFLQAPVHKRPHIIKRVTDFIRSNKI